LVTDDIEEVRIARYGIDLVEITRLSKGAVKVCAARTRPLVSEVLKNTTLLP